MLQHRLQHHFLALSNFVHTTGLAAEMGISSPAAPENLNVDSVISHTLERLQVLQPLHHDGRFERRDHEKREEEVLPVAIQ